MIAYKVGHEKYVNTDDGAELVLLSAIVCGDTEIEYPLNGTWYEHTTPMFFFDTYPPARDFAAAHGSTDVWLVELDNIVTEHDGIRLDPHDAENVNVVWQFWNNRDTLDELVLGEVGHVPEGTVLAKRVRFIEKVR